MTVQLTVLALMVLLLALWLTPGPRDTAVIIDEPDASPSPRP